MKFSPSARLLAVACLAGAGLAAAGPYCPDPDPQIYTLDERPDGNMVVAYSVTKPMATVEIGRYATGGSGFADFFLAGGSGFTSSITGSGWSSDSMIDSTG